jgi:hypothetical protein
VSFHVVEYFDLYLSFNFFKFFLVVVSDLFLFIYINDYKFI